MTTSIPVAIIGAGQAGLAMSRCLTDRSIDHVLLERGEVAHSWRTERWDSLRLLTPNWMTRLPGHRYQGGDPDGFMTGGEVVDLLTGYGRSFAAPVQTNTTVTSIRTCGGDHVITTDQGVHRARAVVIATGAASTPRIPALAAQLPAAIDQITPIHYRNPDQLADGPVLVVGASASGAQLADELRRSGREVTLAVGDHTRLPRTYRGMDIHWWMDTIGLLGERHDEVPDIARARRLPSLQLVGSPDRRDLDLNALADAGVELVGRFAGVSGSTAMFSGSLANLCASADLKLGRLLDRIDAVAAERGWDSELTPGERPTPTRLPAPVSTRDLRSVATVVWATGFRPQYPWLDEHLLDRKGAIRHDGGVMTEPGMYVLGLPFQQHRASSFIDGVGRDAEALTAHLAGWLDTTSSRRLAGV
ncbi:MAG: NAD(P)-binding domain-containing protein [Actinomycetota bacterium]